MLIILRTYKNRPQFTTPAHKHTLVAEGQDDLDHVLLPNNKVMTMHSQEQRPKVCVCVCVCMAHGRAGWTECGRKGGESCGEVSGMDTGEIWPR